MSRLLINSTEIARRQLRHAFKDFDTDKSGFIERNELAVLMKRLTNTFNVEEPSESQINDILRELDANSDGRISQLEFQVLIQEVVKLIEEQKKYKTSK